MPVGNPLQQICIFKFYTAVYIYIYFFFRLPTCPFVTRPNKYIFFKIFLLWYIYIYIRFFLRYLTLSNRWFYRWFTKSVLGHFQKKSSKSIVLKGVCQSNIRRPPFFFFFFFFFFWRTRSPVDRVCCSWQNIGMVQAWGARRGQSA